MDAFTATAQGDAALAYRDAAIANAPPIVVVRMLYQGALRFLERADGADPRARGATFDEGLLRADAAVAELRLALRHDAAPQVAHELERLYLFIEDRIGRALRERDSAPIAEAKLVLARLLEAWTEVEAAAPD